MVKTLYLSCFAQIQALGAAKETLNRGALPSADDLKASQVLFYSAFKWPGTAPRVRAIQARGLGTRGDFEMRFGDHLPNLLGSD